MDSGPVATYQVHEYLRPKLCDLYENDSIFDKFECCLSGDGLRVATGSYSNLFRFYHTFFSIVRQPAMLIILDRTMFLFRFLCLLLLPCLLLASLNGIVNMGLVGFFFLIKLLMKVSRFNRGMLNR
ncbi:protein phosphatase PP2A regulatory subunit B-like [Vicia villosa]|uniref:protein phosphatase PP2A regulatory subunit B-like n=1 Tax=Vicia villosa TaxID=3911 RepID=UPI00273C91F7|nr:protein phosphatase PP2A regulatory subunit B-like [Vicia villosa]